MDWKIDRHPLFAAAYDRLGELERRLLADHRAYLTDDLDGSVLDLGAGTGGSFRALARASNEGELSVHAIEPDPEMHERALRQAKQDGLAVDLREARAESLPYPDRSFDTVVASLVFCTIADPARALGEVNRVLKRDGELRFLEHVRSSGRLGRVQDVLQPIWGPLAGGCHLTRDTRTRLAESPLEPIEVDRFDGIPPAAPMIRGIALRHD